MTAPRTAAAHPCSSRAYLPPANSPRRRRRTFFLAISAAATLAACSVVSPGPRLPTHPLQEFCDLALALPFRLEVDLVSDAGGGTTDGAFNVCTIGGRHYG
jgi:hypothetical protein